MTDVLAGWNDGAAKRAIVEFVEREFGYTEGAEQALEQAGADGWTVVSVKNDWATVFPA